MANYSPDKWQIIKFTSPEAGDVYKVLGGWSGGYLDGDSWRLSSGLERIEEDGDFYLMHNYSGSIYKCHKMANGFNMISSSIYSGWREQLKDKDGYEATTVTIEEFNNAAK